MALTSRARSRTLPACVAVMVVLAAFPFLYLDEGYHYAVAIGMIYAIAAVGLDVFSGYAGVLSISNFAFVAIGCYTAVVLATQYGWSLWAALPAAVVMCALVALVVGAAIVRLADLGAALATFFFAFVVVIMLEGDLLARWTASANGLQVPPLSFLGQDLSYGLGLYFLAWTLLLVVLVAAYRYVNSRAGKTLRLVKRSPVVASALGVNPYTAKLSAFVFSAAVSGVAGFVFAQALTFVTPVNFSGMESVLLLAMAVVGGLGSLAGPIMGAVTFNLLDQVADLAGGAREILFAVLLLVFLVILPQGIYGGLERLSGLLPERVRRLGAGRGAAPSADRHLEITEPILTEKPDPVNGEQRTALELTGVGVRFRGIVALDDVSILVPRRSIYALMGPNGAGKTTLLNCISGIQRHTGDITLDGESLSAKNPRQVRRLGVTRTFQHPSLVDDLSVRENVELGHFGNHPASPFVDALPWPGSLGRYRRDREVAEWALDLVGFPEERRAIGASELTLAEQKLADVARALAGRPRLLLMDEPTAGLEEGEMVALAKVIRQIREQSEITILVIAHHVGFLRSIADHATVMDFGKVLAQGTPEEVIARDDVATVFLGEQHV